MCDLAPRVRDGFTLIEVVVVVLVLGILAGVATPRYIDAIAQARLDAAARRVAADLRYAKAEALRTSRPQQVLFSSASNGYELPSIADPDHPSKMYQVNLAGDPYGIEIDSVDFGHAESVTFSHYGTPSTNGTIYLQHGDHRIAVVCSATGDTGYTSW